MTRITYRFFCLIMGFFLIATTTTTAQSVNFEETWKEFLDNNKISNMSALNKPNSQHDPLNYLKYLMMNMNTSFCQSEIEEAEKMLVAINDIEVKAHQAIPGFVPKLKDLDAKLKAYHSMDAIWVEFLQARTVDLGRLNDVKAAKTSCEKQTLAKYSYMTVYAHFCKGDVAKAKNILENRTLRLTEKTSLRVEDVEGLESEVAKMKLLFQNINELEANWKDYVNTGVSAGYDTELPLFPCYPIPNMKEWLLKGAFDVCNAGPEMLEKVKNAKKESGVALDRDMKKKIKDLEAAIGENEDRLAVLNNAWKAFLPDNEVKMENRKYGFEYCNTEPLIRAYIMEGFANVCGNAEESLQQIDELRQSDVTLTKVTKDKINELFDTHLQTQADEVDINDLWNAFVAQGDTLYKDNQLADYYCDHIYDVKAWLIKGLSSSCQDAIPYLEKIDEVKNNLEFEFAQDIRCRVTKLRIRIWDCRYEALGKLAKVQSPDAVEEKIQELMEEYGVGERPEVCVE